MRIKYLLCEDEDKVWSTVEDTHAEVRDTQTGENVVRNCPHLGMTCSALEKNHTFSKNNFYRL